MSRARWISASLSIVTPLAIALLAASFAACDEQTVDPGDTSAVTSATGATTSGSSMVDPVNITLVHGTDQIVVDLAQLDTVMVKGAIAVPLEAVWAKGALADENTVTFDFEGDDGFHPSQKPACKAFITPAQLAHGYITPDSSRVLIWEDSLGFSGCYFVKGLKTMTGVDGTGT